MHLLHCFLYLAATGIFGFLLGRLLPKRWFSAERFPFRSQPWEEKLYRLLRVMVDRILLAVTGFKLVGRILSYLQSADVR